MRLFPKFGRIDLVIYAYPSCRLETARELRKQEKAWLGGEFVKAEGRFAFQFKGSGRGPNQRIGSEEDRED
jgi:hypothetical protein